MVAALSLLALGLGPGAPLAHAQDLSFAPLEYEAPPPLDARRGDSDRAPRRVSLGLGIAGIATGAVGIVLGGPLLLLAGTTRTHCEGGWFSGRPRTCVPLPHDGGLVAGGAISIGLGAVALITGIVLAATRPGRSGPTLSFGGDQSSVSISIDGTF